MIVNMNSGLLALLVNVIGNMNADCIIHDTSISLDINVSVKVMATFSFYLNM